MGVPARERVPCHPETSPALACSVLLVSPTESDHVSLLNIFSHTRWDLHQARTFQEARACWNNCPVGVVISERNLLECSWQQVLDALQLRRHPPSLIVSSNLADDHLWAEALNLGAYDVLSTPFDQSEVVRVISLAWQRWRNDCDRAGSTAA